MEGVCYWYLCVTQAKHPFAEIYKINLKLGTRWTDNP